VILEVLAGVVLIVFGALFIRNERRAARRGNRRTRRPYLAACVLIIVLGVVAGLLAVPDLIQSNSLTDSGSTL
jgi:uncharacterized membrane protein YfcA